MLTRCPHCQTTFRASPEQLAAAAGRVRCGRCHQVFDANAGRVVEPRAQAKPTPREEAEPLSEAHIESLLRTDPEEGEQVDPYRRFDDLELPPITPAASATPAPAIQPNPRSEPEPFDPDAHSPEEPPDELPLALQETHRRERSAGSVIAWGLGALLLVGLLAAQYGYENRLRLHADPVWSPWIARLCDVVACNLPPERRPEAVELADHTVQSHPRVPGALLITATLRNTAPFAQPYPDVEVLMMDMEQRRVAGRRFTPEEYLTGRPGESFGAKAEAHLLLEVQDPGPSAVSFEFNFR